MANGKLIVVEGACDGIGKTTQFQLLGEHLKSDGKEIITHHFPSYNTYHGKPVEMYLKGCYGQPHELSAYFINSLYAMDRGITWLTKLKKDFEYNKLGIQRPDNVIFLHAPFDLVSEIRNARKQNEGIENDIHESNIEFMRKVYESAMFISEYLGWNKVECNEDNKMKSIDEIHQKVYKLVK